jgi:hypothetical protein
LAAIVGAFMVGMAIGYCHQQREPTRAEFEADVERFDPHNTP